MCFCSRGSKRGLSPQTSIEKKRLGKLQKDVSFPKPHFCLAVHLLTWGNSLHHLALTDLAKAGEQSFGLP